MRTYVYKMTVDNGGAPCVKSGLLSLAICKPAIRRVAPEGSLIFGFAGDCMTSEYPGNRLIYVAIVDKKLSGQEYYSHSEGFSNRPDNIYTWSGQAFTRRSSAAYHDETDLEHDLGKAREGYPNASVLLSQTFRYFGPDGPVPQSAALCQFLKRLTQGHRCNIGAEIAQDLLALRETAFSNRCAGWRKLSSPQPEPNQARPCRSCGEGTSASDDPAFDDPEGTDTFSMKGRC